jgi:hypothetical protein
MPSLFDEKDSLDIIYRINKLHADIKPMWGKMNVGQMLAHCQVPLEVALSDKTLKRSIVGFLFGKMAKKVVVSEKPFKRNLPTAPSFIVKDERNFEKEKVRLVQLIERFSDGGPESITKDPHPFITN